MLKFIVKMNAKELKQYETNKDIGVRTKNTLFAQHNNKAKLESLKFFIV